MKPAIFLWSVLWPLTVLGQKNVISAVGQGFVSAECSGVHITATIGQASHGTFACGDGFVVVGYHQPADPTTVPTPYFEYYQDLTVFPNPALHVIHFSGTPRAAGNLQVLIFNTLGQICHNYVTHDLINTPIDISALPSGVYHIMLTDGRSGGQTLRFAKQ